MSDGDLIPLRLILGFVSTEAKWLPIPNGRAYWVRVVNVDGDGHRTYGEWKEEMHMFFT
jgi:hypothetical protein